MARSENKLFEGLDFSGALDELNKIDADHAAKQSPPSSRLPLASIIEDPNQPRREFDEEKLNELAASIRERDVLQAITVRPPNADGKHVIVMGARRYRASLLAGKETIPAVIRVSASDSYDQMIENIQREALSHRDIAAFIRGQLATGAKKSAIAKSLGKSPAWMTAYADFFDMDPAIQDGIEEYGIRPAYELHAAMQIDPEKTRAFMASGQPVTQRSAASFRQSLKAGFGDAPTGEAKSPPPTGTTDRAETPDSLQKPAKPEDVSPPPAGVEASTNADKPWQLPPLTAENDEEVSGNVDGLRGSESGHSSSLTPLAARPETVSLALMVRVGERVGRLLLNREAEQGEGFCVVLFGEGTQEAKVTELVPVEIVKAERGRSEDA